MLNGLLLILITVGLSVQEITRKAYDGRVKGGVYSFTAASVLFAMLFFVAVSGGSLNFNREILPYSAAFALCYSVASVTTLCAVSSGSLLLTALFLKYSLVVPAIYGIAALGEKMNVFSVTGLVFLIISLLLMNFEGEQKKITLKWALYTLAAFAGNGFCSVVQKVQQVNFGGMYKSEFMIIALVVSFAVIFIAAAVTEKKKMIYNLKKGIACSSVCGIANGMVNFFVLVLTNVIPASVMFPVISAGGMVLTALIAVTVYREKMSLFQKIGFVLGILAIVLLNI